MDATALIDAYCAVWNEPDADARARRLGKVWADGARYTDPSVEAPGAQALLAHIARVRAARPGAQVERTSAVDLHHDVARFAWRAVRGGDVLREGIDIAVLTEGGAKIERMIGFFGPLAEA